MKNPTAAVIIIGNEILSGRTLDTNTQVIAESLAKIGIYLLEVRVVADVQEHIAYAVNELHKKFDYVITTGGIGPTHDDITAKSISYALGLEHVIHKQCYDTMIQEAKKLGREINEAQKYTCYLPYGSQLIPSHLPSSFGFHIQNIFVLAGIPEIMQSMLSNVIPLLKKGDIIHSKNLQIAIRESMIALELSNLQDRYSTVQIGSYPFKRDGQSCTDIVIRATDQKLLDEVYSELKKSIGSKIS